jgi:hypothetical protein
MTKSGFRFPDSGRWPDLNALIIFAQVIAANGFSGVTQPLKLPGAGASGHIADLADLLGVSA